MPQACVTKYEEWYCGTAEAGWLTGQHPNVSQGTVTRRVCFSFHSNCCNTVKDIKIRNCGNFYVYELQPLTAGWRRYCSI